MLTIWDTTLWLTPNLVDKSSSSKPTFRQQLKFLFFIACLNLCLLLYIVLWLQLQLTVFLVFCLTSSVHFLSQTSLVSIIPASVLPVVLPSLHLSLCLFPSWRPFSFIVLFSICFLCLFCYLEISSINYWVNIVWLSIQFNMIFYIKKALLGFNCLHELHYPKEKNKKKQIKVQYAKGQTQTRTKDPGKVPPK